MSNMDNIPRVTVNGVIDGVNDKGPTYEVTFTRDDDPKIGICRLSLPKNGETSAAFEKVGGAGGLKGHKLAFDTTDTDRPRVIDAKIDGIKVFQNNF